MKSHYKIAVKAIIFDQDAVLILRRSIEEREGKHDLQWDFPGGGVESAEPIMDALVREVEEETGLLVNVIAPAYVFDDIQEERHLILLKFACDQPVGQVQLSAEHESHQWISMGSLQQSELPEWMKKEINKAYRLKRLLGGRKM